MKEILILKDHFEDSKKLNDFFYSKQLDSKLVDLNSLNNISTDKSSLVCSASLMEKIGGKSELLKKTRDIGCTNLILLNGNSDSYNIKSDLGGAFLEISYDKIDEMISEIIFQIISTEKYCFSDKKTHALISMAKKVAKLMLQYTSMVQPELVKKLYQILYIKTLIERKIHLLQ